ncbi:hypothetical protein HBI04_227180 [Parastagonospora nodorum]|nr:hypothetical protein HBI04_227180 [Parastagonospora nodorum]KAH4755763.1 hypothetical protein HBH63_231350 [Parastagonospora nodorum]KAH5295532.1 hypothetical protein HBI50_232210 [Parastagonospora nodorum]KAH5296624.1 hypothetical protein HBI12_212760 [Parastagonospora nodorum]KAH6108597.1 hypothetical protein HBI64_228270 [Parastagonospora nodorum]
MGVAHAFCKFDGAQSADNKTGCKKGHDCCQRYKEIMRAKNKVASNRIPEVRKKNPRYGMFLVFARTLRTELDLGIAIL